MINSHDELCEAIGIALYDDPERSWCALEKTIFKGTTCGAWVEKDEFGVSVGSIVEGVDQSCDVFSFEFPLDIKDFWQALTNIEGQADGIWRDTHGCEDCWPDGYFGEWGEREFGCWPINPECKACDGLGVIL